MIETKGPTVELDLKTAGRLGDYELLEEIARGGMGAVYRARQVSLNRLVAVKVLLGGHFAGRSFLQRFRREAEAAASLNHPHIVSVYEVGEHEGQPYFSMELIEGRNLADLVRDKPLPARQAAQLVKAIAEAVHFAHERGLLHRDLKPSNVVVDGSGVPHITDFGLAKRTEDTDLTVTGQVLGTPNYMPPEQADPARGPAGAASDVYSLGAIFYQLLTGRPPYLAETLTQTLRLVADGELVAPRLLNPALSRDLETICAKCLEKDPRRRYASAQELAEELDRFLNDEPIRARPISRPARLLRWCRRKPGIALSICTVAALLLVIAIGSPIAALRIDRARKAAEAAERQTQMQLYTALLEQARATVLSREMGHRIHALDAIRRAGAISNSADLRREAVTALTLPDLRFQQEMSLPPAAGHPVFAPSFEQIAISRGRGPVEVRTVADNRVLATLAASTNLPVFYKQWSAEGRFLAVKRDYPDGGRHGDWEIWDMPKQERVLLLRNVSAQAFSFHPRLPRVIARIRDTVAVWSLEDGRELIRFPLAGRAVVLDYSPQGERIAAISARNDDRGRRLSVHDATNPQAAELVSCVFPDDVTSLAWHPDGQALLAPDHGGGVHWVNARTGESELLGRHKSRAARAAFSPDGAYLFTGGWDRELICWDARTKRRVFAARLDSSHLQFSADGQRCGVMTETSARLYTFERPAAHREFAEDLGGKVQQATISPNGRWLAASGDKRAAVWDLSSAAPGVIEVNAYGTHFFFTPDSRELFGSRNEGVEASFRWRLIPPTNATAPPGLARLPLKTPKGLTTLSLASNALVVTSQEGSQILAPGEIESGSERWMPTKPGINGASPDGRWLGIRRHNGSSLYVYRLPDLAEVAKLTHPVGFGDFDFSPHGDEVAIGSLRAGALVTFWETKTWERTRTLTNFSRVIYTPDPSRLWLAEDRRTGGLYDARTVEPLLLLPKDMFPLTLSPDGQQVVVSVDARRVQLWDLAELRKQLRSIALDWSETPAVPAAREAERR